MDLPDNHDTRDSNHRFQQSESYTVPSYPFAGLNNQEEPVQSTLWQHPHSFTTSGSLAAHPIAAQSTTFLHPAERSTLSSTSTDHLPETSISGLYHDSNDDYDAPETYTYSIPFKGRPGQQPPAGGYYDPENELKQSDDHEEPFTLQMASVRDLKVLTDPLKVNQIPYVGQAQANFDTHLPREYHPQIPLYPESYPVTGIDPHHRLQHRVAYNPSDAQSYDHSSLGYHDVHYASQVNQSPHMMVGGDIDRQHSHQPCEDLFPVSPFTVSHPSYTYIPTPRPTEYSLPLHPQAPLSSSVPTSYSSINPVSVSADYSTTIGTEATLPSGPRPGVMGQGTSASEGWQVSSSSHPIGFPLDAEEQIFHNETTMMHPHSTSSAVPIIHKDSSSTLHHSPDVQNYHAYLQSSLQQQQQQRRHQISGQQSLSTVQNSLPSPSTSASSKPSQSFVYPDQDQNLLFNAGSANSSMESRSRSVSHSTSSSSPVPQNTPLSALHFSTMGQPIPYYTDSEPASAQVLTFADRLIDLSDPTMSITDVGNNSLKQNSASKKKRRTVHPNPPLASCSLCQKPLMRLLMRGTAEDWGIDWVGWWICKECSGGQPGVTSQNGARSDTTGSGTATTGSIISSSGFEKGKRKDRPAVSTFGQSTSGSLTIGTGAGGVGRRKRTRETMNTEAPLICDVCFRFKGQGGIVPRDGRTELKFSVEFVCVSCEEKYKRCTDCGSGGGARIGIGKWRSKELFVNNRKTCSLSHVRIGSAPMKIGLWDMTEIDSEQVWNELLNLCEALWKDRLLSRMAIPDVLEANLGDLNDRPRTFADVQATLDAGWPGRQPLVDARRKTMSPNASLGHPDSVRDGGNRTRETTRQNFKKYIGLTWCKCKPRRSGQVSTGNDDGGSLGENPGSGDAASEDSKKDQQTEENPGDPVGHESTDGVVPSGYELVGLYIGDWNMDNGTLLITTSLPFEGSDSEDRTSMTVGEMILRIVTEIEEAKAVTSDNKQNLGKGQERTKPPSLEHLWCISDGMTSQIRDKMHESLTRKRQFLPLDEYLAQHPTVRPEIFHDFPYSLPGPWVDGVGIPGTIMVRWLGSNFDRKQLEESVAKNEAGRKSIKARIVKE